MLCACVDVRSGDRVPPCVDRRGGLVSFASPCLVLVTETVCLATLPMLVSHSRKVTTFKKPTSSLVFDLFP